MRRSTYHEPLNLTIVQTPLPRYQNHRWLRVANAIPVPLQTISGKGTPRRKAKKVHKTSGTDDKKLQTALKKLNVQPIQAIEEVNMFKEDGNVIHFAAPKGACFSISFNSCLSSLQSLLHFDPLLTFLATFSLPPPTRLPPKTNPFPSTVHASVPSNTFAIYGAGEDKELTELVPGILNQLGPDSLASLRKLAESYQSLQKKDDTSGAAGGKKGGDDDDDDDDDIPDLVEGDNFESKVE